MAKKLYIQEYIGLCNRLESLALALAVQRRHGHEIWLDWQELDALKIDGTRRGSPGFFGRLGALRLRSCSPEEFPLLGRKRRILLRTCLGPVSVIEPAFRDAIGRIRILPWVADEIRRLFAPCKSRPLVGLHIRRGDFQRHAADHYDRLASRHPMVPLWWFESVMTAILAKHPDTVFFVSHSGPREEMATLASRFSVVTCGIGDPYRRSRSGHEAASHPVIDLFALACCPVILGTPGSTFTHYAAHVLNPGSTLVLPPMRIEHGSWGACRFLDPGVRLEALMEILRKGESQKSVSPAFEGIEFPSATVEWLPVADGHEGRPASRG